MENCALPVSTGWTLSNWQQTQADHDENCKNAARITQAHSHLPVQCVLQQSQLIHVLFKVKKAIPLNFHPNLEFTPEDFKTAAREK